MDKRVVKLVMLWAIYIVQMMECEDFSSGCKQVPRRKIKQWKRGDIRV